jgi:hypothetical protein
MLLVALHPTSYKATIVFPEKSKTEKKKNKETVYISIQDILIIQKNKKKKEMVVSMLKCEN